MKDIPIDSRYPITRTAVRAQTRSVARVGLLLSALSLLPAFAGAQTYRTWTGADNTQFINDANWNTSTPISTTVGLFTGTVTANQPILGTADRTVNGLSFTTATGGWTIGVENGRRLNIDASIPTLFGIQTIGQSSGINTINPDILVGANGSEVTWQNWSVGTGGTLIINGNIIGQSNGYLQIGTASTGEGILVLNGTNSRSDITELVAGTILLAQSNGFGSGNINVLSSGSGGQGATIASNSGALSFNNTISLGSGTALTVGGTQNMTFNGIISGAGNLIVSTTGTMNITADATATGTTTIESGATLLLGNGATSGQLASSGAGIVINGGGTLAFDRSDTFLLNTTSNPLSGSGTLRYEGTGILQTNGNTSGTFTGGVHAASGEIFIAQLNALGGNASTGTFTVDSGAIIRFASQNLTQAGDLINNGSVIMKSSTVTNGLTFAAGKTVSGTGVFSTQLAKTGTADFTFAGNIEPGASADTVGTFTFGDGTIAAVSQFMNTSTTVWNLSGTGGVAGTDFDNFIIMAGSSVILISGAELQIDLLYAWDDSDSYWQTSHSYALFDTSVVGSFDLVDNEYSGALGSGNFTFDGQKINYSFTPVPEPGAFALLAGIGIGALAILRRRRIAVQD